MRIWLRFSFGFCWFDSEISSGWSSFNRNCKKRNSAWTSFRFQDRNNPLRDSSSEFFFCLIRYQKRSQWRSNIFTWHCHNFLLFHHFYFFLLITHSSNFIGSQRGNKEWKGNEVEKIWQKSISTGIECDLIWNLLNYSVGIRQFGRCDKVHKFCIKHKTSGQQSFDMNFIVRRQSYGTIAPQASGYKHLGEKSSLSWIFKSQNIKLYEIGLR